MKGQFIISLDFEIHWGVYDALSLDQYRENLLAVPEVIKSIMTLAEEYGVKLTFATVGFLFARNKEEILKFSPGSKPSYQNLALDPYLLIDDIGPCENEDSLHYAISIIDKIANSEFHEIGSHTYSHYNCFAHGQSIEQFEADIIAAKSIAESKGIELKSIVFPKNQVLGPYLKVCEKHGFTSFRGNENSILYNDTFGKIKAKFPLFRMLRMVDAYVNISGYHTYQLSMVQKDGNQILNLPSSRFLRPYLNKFSFLEPLKIRRITKAMEHAARKNEMYHLWWHPHNFGVNIRENLTNLRYIFEKYKELHDKYGFQSESMTGLTNKLISKSQ
ncbi:polysaccharide deacetylase family protein [Muriicola marianensis]|uniref:NodB homology domain-containing protein n=1 Tax=Muriicola marianensis TaxID=1324801 RepID=A0ABQ1QQL5_9FLAO|nr:polysaccharide deacetylase family protein [Muriicola marianensis]GGD41016.1 hypothetical protein GCM10011361_05160 [Muriicola marianensis]